MNCALQFNICHFILFYVLFISYHRIESHTLQYMPVDTGRKLNVHKTFRRHPGRLLNALCTFNLRPVSTMI